MELNQLVAEKSSSGDLYINLAENYFSGHEWGLALQALKRGLEKGRLSDPDLALRLQQQIGHSLGLKTIGS